MHFSNLIAICAFSATAQSFNVSHEVGLQFKDACSALTTTSKRDVQKRSCPFEPDCFGLGPGFGNACIRDKCEVCYGKEASCRLCNSGGDPADDGQTFVACLAW